MDNPENNFEKIDSSVEEAFTNFLIEIPYGESNIALSEAQQKDLVVTLFIGGLIPSKEVSLKDPLITVKKDLVHSSVEIKTPLSFDKLYPLTAEVSPESLIYSYYYSLDLVGKEVTRVRSLGRRQNGDRNIDLDSFCYKDMADLNTIVRNFNRKSFDGNARFNNKPTDGDILLLQKLLSYIKESRNEN